MFRNAYWKNRINKKQTHKRTHVHVQTFIQPLIHVFRTYEGVSKIFRTDAVKFINLTTKRVWQLPTSTQLREIWHTDALDMVDLPSIGASRYRNCCIDGGNFPEYFGYTLVIHIRSYLDTRILLYTCVRIHTYTYQYTYMYTLDTSLFLLTHPIISFCSPSLFSQTFPLHRI
jgi:hypothetical protein